MTRTARLPYQKLAPKAFRKMLDLSAAVHDGLLDRRLIDFVFLRVSQLNGCAFCTDMHWRDLMQQGVDPRHANGVAVWREAPFFDDRQRAALHWAELLTVSPHSEESEASFTRLRQQFSDEEIAELGFAIAAINAWNVLGIGFRSPIPERA
ncbi:MAG TPA: carboxymuconolactone decarboxylase family protein [Burkholderiaceae bacterium]|nr:carboxymuconolactone decarboxylase family protein [Burkholderiaceae bacterium]